MDAGGRVNGPLFYCPFLLPEHFGKLFRTSGNQELGKSSLEAPPPPNTPAQQGPRFFGRRRKIVFGSSLHQPNTVPPCLFIFLGVRENGQIAETLPVLAFLTIRWV